MNKIRTIIICSSASFFRDVLAIRDKLKRVGFQVKIPLTAEKMKKSGDFKVRSYKTWFKDDDHYKIKTKLIKDHFKKVIESDAILVVNQRKNGTLGYIGGNTLMEMTIAFHYKKPIYLWNPIAKGCPFEEEIRGLNPVIINQDLLKMK